MSTWSAVPVFQYFGFSSSAWSTHASSEYWVKGRPLWLFHCVQYWIACQPDLTPHPPLSIGSRVGTLRPFRGFNIRFHIMATIYTLTVRFEYWVKWYNTQWMRNDQAVWNRMWKSSDGPSGRKCPPILNGWLYRSGWYGIEYWILGMVGVADPWPNALQWMQD